MLELLGGIRETTVIFQPEAGRTVPRTAKCLSALDSEQAALMAALELTRYQAK
jgi:hypothetical protein